MTGSTTIARWPRPARVAVVVAVVLAAVGLASCGSEGGTADRLPTVDLVSLATGETVVASSIDGPAVVNLWATWCGPCRTEMPAFQQVHDELGDAVAFVGINEGDTGPDAAEFVESVGVDYTQLLDEDGALTDALRIAGLPATIVIDAAGTVVEVHSGALDAAGLRSLIDDQLGIT